MVRSGAVVRWFPDAPQAFRARSRGMSHPPFSVSRPSRTRPVMCPFHMCRDAMRERIANLLDIDIGAISVKATTTERLGFAGRGEGIACQAICLLEPVES